MINYDTIKNFDNMTEEEIIGFLDDNQIDIRSLYRYDGNTIVTRQDSEEDIREIFTSSPVLEEQDWKYLFVKIASRLLTQQKLSEMQEEMVRSRLGEQEADLLYANLYNQYKCLVDQSSVPISDKAMQEAEDLYQDI